MKKSRILNSLKELTAFEWILWAVSCLAVTVSFVLPEEKDYISLISSLIGASALIFVAKGMVIGQILAVIFSVFYGIISYKHAYYGEMITYLCMSAPSAMASVISWIKHPYKESAEVEVNRLSKRCKSALILLAPTVTFIFYFILKYLGNANLYVSTLSITTSFVASYLIFFRSSYYAIAYALNDMVLIVLWVSASFKDISSLPMVFCFLAFLLSDLYGFYNWERMRKKQSRNT